MRQIAAKVGVSDPALYSHFKGKKAIFEALMQEAMPGILGAISDVKPLTDLHPRTAIPEIFQAIVMSWAMPRARAFTSLMLRMGPEGIGNALREV